MRPDHSILSITQARSLPFAERFWAKVKKASGLFWNGTECWLWTAGVDKDGYGKFGIMHADRSHSYRAHRVAYELIHGPIGDGQLLLHHCDRPPCVNPAHLYLGRSRDNTRDMIERGRFPRGERSFSRQHPERLARGERHGRALLTAVEVVAIRARYAAGGITQRELARMYGVSEPNIQAIVLRLTWRHLRSP